MTKFVLSRRTMLKGLLGGSAVTIGLPPLDAFFNESGTAHADGGQYPKRFGVFFWGNGNIPDRWEPKETGRDWQLTEQLEPLAEVKEDITVLTNYSVKTGNIIPHISGAAGMLSGAPLIERGDDSTFSLPSIDQVIAKELRKHTRFPSIESGVKPRHGLSYNGPDSRNPPEASPLALFNRIFGGGFREPGDNTMVDPSIRLRRSVLDAVLDPAQKLKQRLGASDKIRIEKHMAGIRALEESLLKLELDPPQLESCKKPMAPAAEFPNMAGRPPMSAISEAMNELLAMALACDQTRVFSHFFSYPVSNTLYLDATAGHHQLTHDEPGEQPGVHSIVRFIMGELNKLLLKLKSIPEGDGNLLDHSAVLCCSEVSLGRTHLIERMPILIAGDACGALKKGFHHRSETKESVSKVLLSLVRAMDIPAASFGTGDGEEKDGVGAIEA